MDGLVGYTHIGVMLLVAATIAGTILGISFVVGPRNPNPRKSQPYECGIEEVVPMPKRVSVKFLQVAMLFLIFDVEAVAFYPLATILKAQAQTDQMAAAFLLAEMLVFVVLLVVGYLYVWKKGAFKWTS